MADWAKSEALAHHAAEEGGRPHTSLGYRLAHKLILSKVFLMVILMVMMMVMMIVMIIRFKFFDFDV